MASHGELDLIASNEVRRSRGRGSTRSPSQACAQRKTVDHISGHRTVKLLLRFGDHGRHVEASVAFDLHRKGKGSWDHGLWDRGPR